jgi:biotin operon repressor
MTIKRNALSGKGPKPKKSTKVVEKELHTRDQVARILDVRKMLMKGDYPSLQEMADMLGTSVRTIHRYKSFLKNRGYPIEYNAAKGGYYCDPVKSYNKGDTIETGHKILEDYDAFINPNNKLKKIESLEGILPQSKSLTSIVYYTLERIERWQRSQYETHKLGILYKGCLIFEYLIGRSVFILCSTPVRIEDLQTNNVMEEQVITLESLSKELSPKAQKILGDFMKDGQLLSDDDSCLIKELCDLRTQAIAPKENKSLLEHLRHKSVIFEEFLLKLKQFCESRFIACVTALEPKMKLLAND